MLDFESFGIATVMNRFASLRLEPEMLPTSILFNHRDTENTEDNQEHESILGVKHGAVQTQKTLHANLQDFIIHLL